MKDKTHIFCFHRISDEYSPAYPPIPVNVFDNICRHISKKYAVIPLAALHEKPLGNKLRAIITFDDAYYDFYENAMPVLTKYKLPTVQHVITSCAETGESFWTQKLNKLVEYYQKNKLSLELPELGFSTPKIKEKDIEPTSLKLYRNLLTRDDKMQILSRLELGITTDVSYTRMMSWREINDCTKYDVLIGTHSHTHQNLASLTHEQLDIEIGVSVALINENIGQCISIAFPNGVYSSTTVDVAIMNKIPFMFTTELSNLLDGINHVVYPRFSLYHNVYWKNFIRLNLFG